MLRFMPGGEELGSLHFAPGETHIGVHAIDISIDGLGIPHRAHGIVIGGIFEQISLAAADTPQQAVKQSETIRRAMANHLRDKRGKGAGNRDRTGWLPIICGHFIEERFGFSACEDDFLRRKAAREAAPRRLAKVVLAAILREPDGPHVRKTLKKAAAAQAQDAP